MSKAPYGEQSMYLSGHTRQSGMYLGAAAVLVKVGVPARAALDHPHLPPDKLRWQSASGYSSSIYNLMNPDVVRVEVYAFMLGCARSMHTEADVERRPTDRPWSCFCSMKSCEGLARLGRDPRGLFDEMAKK